MHAQYSWHIYTKSLNNFWKKRSIQCIKGNPVDNVIHKAKHFQWFKKSLTIAYPHFSCTIQAMLIISSTWQKHIHTHTKKKKKHLYRMFLKGLYKILEGIGHITRIKNWKETHDCKCYFNLLRAWCFKVFFSWCGCGFCILNL